MEASETPVTTKEPGERLLSTGMEESTVVAVLAAALLAYRQRLALVDKQNAPTCSGAQWHAVARWQQLAPTTRYPLRRQG
jgi:hypothetical protein